MACLREGVDRRGELRAGRLGRLPEPCAGNGTRVEDRRLDKADGLRKRPRLRRDRRVRDLSLPARERPDNPVERHVTREDVAALCASPPFTA